MYDRRVLLFAHQRSGSSSLYQILQSHPHLNIIEEPFNEGFAGWYADNPDYLSRVHDIPSLDAVLDDIFQTYNGIKLLGYQLSDDLDHHLLHRPDCDVIFLRRRNILQAVVSVMIAHQNQLWKKWDMNQPFHDYFRSLQPLDTDEIALRVRELTRHLDAMEAIVDQRTDGATIKLVYEELYFAPPDRRNEQIDAIWHGLGLPPLDPASYQYFLRPEDVKINGAATYRAIPNADDIERRCGSDATGWLFASTRFPGS